MPPKDTSITLTAAEQKMLTAVVGLMGDVPNVDYNVLAEAVGQKYARNARAGCKRLFEKIRATNGYVQTDAGPGAGKSASPKKGTANKVIKKSANMVGGKKKAKEEVKEEVKEESEDEDVEEVDREDEEILDGKLNPSVITVEQQAQILRKKAEPETIRARKVHMDKFGLGAGMSMRPKSLIPTL